MFRNALMTNKTCHFTCYVHIRNKPCIVLQFVIDRFKGLSVLDRAHMEPLRMPVIKVSDRYG